MMESISRAQFLDRLRNNWQPYISRFTSLSAQEQKEFLVKQGYSSLSDLLAHIIAWWQDGFQFLAKMREDPALVPPDYDVDAFNAQAVQRFHGWSESAVIQAYEVQRQVMLDLVLSLPDADLNNERINTRLCYEIMMHWKEHELN
jgi:hypothetical protein